MFWADSENGTVERVNKENGLDHVLIQVKNSVFKKLDLEGALKFQFF